MNKLNVPPPPRDCAGRKGAPSDLKWVVTDTVQAWRAPESYLVLPGTVFVTSPPIGPPRRKAEIKSCFLRLVADNAIEVNNGAVDLGCDFDRFKAIIQKVHESLGRPVIVAP